MVRPSGWRDEPARHALAARGVKSSPSATTRRQGACSQLPTFNGVQDRVMIKGISKSRWRCPECLRALVSDADGHYQCRIHGPVTNEGLMKWGTPGRNKALDATMLSDEEQDMIIEIGR